MKLVKPYGRSATQIKGNRISRELHRRESPNSMLDFQKFSEEDFSFILAQWISVIDKVAIKPTGRDHATKRQHEFREILGASVWAILRKKEILPEIMRDKFDAKIHPYPDGVIDDEGIEKRTQKKGRWYRTFLGEVPYYNADTRKFGQMVYDHLYLKARHVHPQTLAREPGLNKRRTLSVAKSSPRGSRVAKEEKPDRTKAMSVPLWSETDGQVDYTKNSNLAQKVLDMAVEKESDGKALLSRHVGGLLYAHYKDLFFDELGERPMKRQEVRDAGQSGLLDYHDAVKDTYRRILSGHKTHNVMHPNTEPPRGQAAVLKSKLSQVLPQTPRALFERVMQGRKNQNVNALIRLGKVAHYTFSPGEQTDDTNTAVEHWNPDGINNDSMYWTSDGLGQVKRNEALIRVWRTLLTSAILTTVDWINPNQRVEGDPTIGPDFRNMLVSFDESHFDKKTKLLFGSRSEPLLQSNPEEKVRIVEILKQALSDMRNASFHFKGRSQFAVQLAKIGRGVRTEKLGYVFEKDAAELGQRIVRDLRGANLEFFAKQRDVGALLNALQQKRHDGPVRPKLNRVLKRAANTWKNPKLDHLPLPPKHRELEAVSALRCRYVVTKLLYDRVFPTWLKENSGRLNDWKDQAVARTTEAAQKISGDEQAIARAAKSLVFSENGITDPIQLIARISAETATEIRVQKGYDPDPEAARKKSEYLDNVVMDIFSLAFNEFMARPQFLWLLRLDNQTVQPGKTISALPSDFHIDVVEDAGEWEKLIYALLHLVPTTEVSNLLHQLKKWDVLSSPRKTVSGRDKHEQEQFSRVMAVLKLYLDMADDKFDGGESIDLEGALTDLFDKPSTFKLAYPNANAYNNDDSLIPIRGLREALRFGDMRKYNHIFSEYPITEVYWTKLRDAEPGGPNSLIAGAQDTRTKLHAEWVKKKGLSKDDNTSYHRAIKTIAGHREVSAHLRFINHVRLHRLTTQLLGRFADYAGLFERDVYFATMGLMLERNITPVDTFSDVGLRFLKEGRIIDALGQATNTTVLQKLKLYFHVDFMDKADPLISIRNKMQHLSYILGDYDKKTGAISTSGYASITAITNDLRRLMQYDRKLKNAVSKSVIGILAREKLGLNWTMRDHLLAEAKISTHQALHIKSNDNIENLNTRMFTLMVAKLFGGKAEIEKDVVGRAIIT